jgi:thiol-disulfide isomerase/thioredoxin
MNQHGNCDLVVPVSAVDHLLGPADASVTMVEYGDFECPNCKQAAPALKHVVERFEGRVRLVYRHFPLVEVHPHALHAALAVEAASAQGRFWEMHDLLFENQSRLQLKQLRSYAERLGLDLVKYDTEMRGELYLQRVREDIEGGRQSGVRSTPGIFVDGRRHDVSFGFWSLANAFDAALSRLAPHCAMANIEPIQDAGGKTLGSLETASDGSQVLRDAQGRIRGYYDPVTDHTRDPDRRILAKGNELRTLIC